MFEENEKSFSSLRSLSLASLNSLHSNELSKSISFTSTKTTSSLLHTASSRNSFTRLLFESEQSGGGGGDDRDLLFRFCQIIVLSIRAITPIAYILVFFRCREFILLQYTWTSYFQMNSLWDILRLVLDFWAVIEVLFFPYYLYLFHYLHHLNDNLNHIGLTSNERQKLIHNCFEALKVSVKQEESHLYVRKVLEGWFLDVPITKIHRENMKSWVSWAFFGKDVKTLSNDEEVEMEDHISYIEDCIDLKFSNGFASDIMSVRLTLDPIFATQRPFFFYAVILIVNQLAHLVLYAWGFTRRRKYDSNSMSIYYRPAQTKISNLEINKIPLVFIHGIGIGFAHYLGLIYSFPRDVDVYLVEWSHVAMQMSYIVPSSSKVVSLLTKVLDDDQHPEACFLGHSLGTTAISWMLHSSEGKKKVASTLLLDPVVFLLCDPKVATAFVYKNPTTAIDFLMHFFLSRELFIANSLSRHFSWSENILFVEDLSNCSRMRSRSRRHMEDDCNDDDYAIGYDANMSRIDNNNSLRQKVNHTIILSNWDTIVPVEYVQRYLTFKSTIENHDSFETLLFDRCTHGEMFLWPQKLSLIRKKIEDRCIIED